MDRVDDTMRAIDCIREDISVANAEGIEQIKVALLGHIAISLAVIADTLQAKNESEDEK